MAASARHKGWYFDASNDRLDIYYNGTRVGHVNASGLTTVTGITLTTGALTVSDTTAAHSIDGTDLSMPNLPTMDPSAAGQLWNNMGVLTVSSG